MKNKEKFAKEILDIVCNGDDVGWTYETSDEPVWMSKINAECVITDVIEFIESVPNENEVTFEVKK